MSAVGGGRGAVNRRVTFPATQPVEEAASFRRLVGVDWGLTKAGGSGRMPRAAGERLCSGLTREVSVVRWRPLRERGSTLTTEK